MVLFKVLMSDLMEIEMSKRKYLLTDFEVLARPKVRDCSRQVSPMRWLIAESESVLYYSEYNISKQTRDEPECPHDCCLV